MSREPLSEREREILRLVAIGATNQRIAHELNISINTVKVHVRNIFTKIGVGSRAEAALHATQIGLVAAPDLTPIARTSADDRPAAAVAALDPPLVAGAPVARWRAVPFWLVPGIVGGAIVIVLLALQFLPAALSAWGATPAPRSGANIQRWRELADLPTPRAGFAVASLSVEGKPVVYAIGGDSGKEVMGQVVRYDPASDLWVELTAKPTPVADVRAAVVGNKIYVVGGRVASGQPTTVFEAYDPQRDRWTTLAPLPAPRAGHAVAAVEGKIYVIGGWDGSKVRADVWQYSPDDDSWRPRSHMPTARAFASVAVADGRIHVLAGEGESGPLTVNERYSPAAEDGSDVPWSIRAPLPLAAGRGDAAAAGGYVFVAGLDDAPGKLAVYTPQTDSWRTSDVPLGAVLDLRVQAIGTKLYLLGGRSGEGPSGGAIEYQVVSTIFLPVVQ